MKKPKKTQETESELNEIKIGNKLAAQKTLKESGKKNPADEKLAKFLKTGGKPKNKKALKIAALTLTLGFTAFWLYNQIADHVYTDLPAKDPFTSGNVWDGNGNDLDFDDNGNIIVDKMTDSDKQILDSQINNLILQDANSRSETPVAEIKDILSISLLPYNLCEENNEFDKYFLSILFSDSNDTYALNYFTGTDFVSKEENSKNFFSDFLDYVNHECALDNCSKMSETASEVKAALGEDILHVGDSYLGYRENGDEYYFIPTYKTDGTATVYSTWSSRIDAYDLVPMEKLLEEISDKSSEKFFQATDCEQSETLQKMMQLVEEISTNSNTPETKNRADAPKKFQETEFTR